MTQFSEPAKIIDAAFGLVKAGFMNFYFHFSEKNVLQGLFRECFAHTGVSKYGLIDNYDCGIVV